jgi:hypothetical protein
VRPQELISDYYRHTGRINAFRCEYGAVPLTDKFPFTTAVFVKKNLNTLFRDNKFRGTNPSSANGPFDIHFDVFSAYFTDLQIRRISALYTGYSWPV